MARLVAFFACLWPLSAPAQISPDDLLPVEEAFALEATADDGVVVLHWEIADGYYLYRHAFEVTPVDDDAVFGALEIPAGETTVDEFFGETETYRGSVTLRAPVERTPSDGRLLVRVASQGCADLGVCYPPHRQEVTVQLVEHRTTAPADRQPARRGNALDSILGGQRQALPEAEAFRVEAIAVGPRELLVRATASPDYYLYRESFSFGVPDQDIEITNLELPAGAPKTDEYFGETRVYFGEVEIPLRLARPAGGEREIVLEANFQGCLDDGICYPPMTRSIDVTLPPAEEDVSAGAAMPPAPAKDSGLASERPAAEVAGAVLPISEQDRLARFIEEQPLPLAMGLFLLLGIGLAFTPCVFPMIPILSGIIAGEGEGITRGRSFGLSLAYVLAMALTYTSVGVIAALAGYNLQAAFQNPWVLGTFAAIFVALAMAMFGLYNLQMPTSWQSRLTEISNRQSGGSFIGAGIMGFLSALIVGPCVTAPLVGILMFISQTGDAVLGGSVLFALSMGMGLPLLAIGVGLGQWLPRAGGWMDAVKAVFGVGLLALAIWMLERVLPGTVIMLMWGALAIGCGVYLGALTRLDPDAGGWRKLWQALGVMLLILGIAQFVGALSGGRDWTRPIDHLAGGASGAAVAEAPEFLRVETLEQLQAAIDASERPVFLDFYADWCVDCVRMERRTFPDPAVAGRLDDFTLLKADITAYNDEHKAMLQHFDLIGPPAYLFFVDGEELPQFRMFGFLGPGEFLPLLDEVAR
ncbi:MAG: protein-disulfide reductase DsbD [Gammaproteobacteria bacterium]|nr:protein-disulfide reductase DsbD [Gammaproteobacteria bacterium]